MKGFRINISAPYDQNRMEKDMALLKKHYGLRTSSIGKTAEGREILLVRIGTGKKKLLCVGAHHAREYVSSAYLMLQLEFLLKSAKEDFTAHGAEVRMLLRNAEVYFVPMLNPDGVNISIFGAGAAKAPEKIKKMRMIHPTYKAWKANANGTDLNRHYPCLWEEKHSGVTTPASEGFKGHAPATEPEVKALMAFCEKERFDMALTFHAKGEEIYWGDMNSVSRVPHAKTTAKALAGISGYTCMPVSGDPKTYAAGFENWFRDVYEKPCLLIELAPYDGYLPTEMKTIGEKIWKKTAYLIITCMKFL